ncbi:MAG TPA: sigma-54 dependent transcriptional regulator [Terracidiphilus sp.]|nr:sigma-54 dependent transcriptional regulator [Terracidiphilus sp.]
MEFQFFFESKEDGVNRLLSDKNCQVMILDLNSNHDSLKERIACARRLIASNVAWVIMADDGLRATANELVRQGAFGYCRRPPSIRDLRITLRRAYENSSFKRQSEQEKQRMEIIRDRDQMVGSSSAMQQVHHLIDCVSNIDASVLITGESGTGKELVARAIHNRGNRGSRPFIAVACGAIPETLIEAELFGHEKGAYTGTVGSREGYLEQSRDGTLFLDEIGELSLFTQVKLLRVLQQREFSRLGSNRLIPLRSRLIFATHRNLAEMVAQGKFRQDLYYRINVMKIEIPSLQERSDDIGPIASHFLHHYARIFQKPVEEIEPEAMSVLQSYAWPGNVRELENVIQRAIILAKSNTLRLADLPSTLREESRASFEEPIPGGSFEAQLRDYKIRLAATAVRENNGNKTLAARSLSISRAYLHRLIRLADPEALYEEEGMEIETT